MEDPGALVEVSEGSSSSTLALRARSPTSSSEDEIQVWISYANSEGTQTTILRMMPEETIADVKLRVQARKGWFASQQKLTFGDMELEDAKTIELVARAAGISRLTLIVNVWVCKGKKRVAFGHQFRTKLGCFRTSNRT